MYLKTDSMDLYDWMNAFSQNCCLSLPSQRKRFYESCRYVRFLYEKYVEIDNEFDSLSDEDRDKVYIFEPKIKNI